MEMVKMMTSTATGLSGHHVLNYLLTTINGLRQAGIESSDLCVLPDNE